LESPGDERLAKLVRDIFAYPDVPASWQTPDFAESSQAVIPVGLRRGELELRFLTTITTFNAPQNVTVEEIRIESYFPLDDATAAACDRLAER
jgi:hypothetical protein